MGVVSFTQESACPVPPARMFKALMIDSHKLLPKLLPQSIKSVDMIQGDGGVGTIIKINFAEGSPFKYVKHRIDALDKENLECKYTLIEGDALMDKLESINYEAKFEPSADGGCVIKKTSKYNTIGDFEIKEEQIKEGKERAMGMYKVVEAYLLANPEA
ncbi:hypothetical protein HHK36_022986 [Tetracentron sinense]|uniref:Bet v I/Major latex protein domain-containing protein n=1 Tax=Tetracentron sinense TaxID=13715 RepID=A0A834YQI0_TETSI|nr:hypothetical protein HHK36_022986 [Tetracentron sinense]